MSHNTFRRRTVTKGVAWALPAVTMAAATPAHAASGAICLQVTSSGCWGSGCFVNYYIMSTPQGLDPTTSTTSQLQSSNRFTAAQAYPAGTKFNFTYRVVWTRSGASCPATAPAATLNGEFGAGNFSSSWANPVGTAPAATTIGTPAVAACYSDYTITATAGASGVPKGSTVCGGISLVLPLTYTTLAGYWIQSVSIQPSGTGTVQTCKLGFGTAISGNATVNTSTYGAAETCNGSSVWG